MSDLNSIQTPIAWGLSVSDAFRGKVVAMALEHGSDPSNPMACMAFESGQTFRPDIRNAAGSGAVGLIQFMKDTAEGLGTTPEALAAMTAEDQLDYVARFFEPHKGHLHNLGDWYMAVLWPSAIGKPDEFVLFDKADPAHPKRYIQNKGLDFNADGKITRGEACARVRQVLEEGLKPTHAYTAP